MTYYPNRQTSSLYQVLLVLVASTFSCCQATSWSDTTWTVGSLRAYYAYKDAECLEDGSGGISGTAYMSYDDVSISAMLGIIINNYEGACMYFPDGSIDIYDVAIAQTSGLDGTNLMRKDGICTECYGLTGCSTDGTCDTFMTYPPAITTTEGYQLSYSSDKIDTKDKELMATIKAPAMMLQEAVTYNAVSNQQTYSDAGHIPFVKDDLQYYLLGSFIGFAGLVTIVAVLEGLRQRRVEREIEQVQLQLQSQQTINVNSDGTPYAFV